MNIVVMPGDDIGPEIVRAALAVLTAADEAFSLGLQLTSVDVGMASYRAHGTTLTATALQAAIDADGVILGPCGMTDYPPRDRGGVNVPGTIRKRLDLYANLRPARSRSGVPDARRGLDVLIVRENTEGFYADRNMFEGIAEFMPTEDVALSVRKITRQGSRRIAKVAMEYALRRGGRVTAVGKQHVLQVTDGLFMREAHAAAGANPQIAFREMDIDAMAADLYSRPERHDVILITNMFGDILSNEAAALSGGLGLAAALNAGEQHAIANAGHGSAPDIAGKDIANPCGMILSTAMLLDWLGVRHHKPCFLEACRAIEVAVEAALLDDAVRTGDLGGRGGTRQFGDAVAARVRAGHAIQAASV
ncbi:MAG: isocitrate/isopropylmalate dehydrogenase family protein [Burkholderiales bacterium]|nr:isocitrate/isopropylmalate dehydrogenase family protein [Burkholderiales bacterium]